MQAMVSLDSSLLETPFKNVAQVKQITCEQLVCNEVVVLPPDKNHNINYMLQHPTSKGRKGLKHTSRLINSEEFS